MSAPLGYDSQRPISGRRDAQSTPCQSVRGEWGQPCPDCGQTLPPIPAPLQGRTPKPTEWLGSITGRKWTPEARAARVATFQRKAAEKRQRRAAA